MSGPIGLRYETIYPILDRMNISNEKWDELLIDIELMERAALAEIHKKS